jgi:hypothetical protein
MGTVTTLADFRAARAKPAAEAPTIAPLNRTVELAILLALLDTLPVKSLYAVSRKVRQIADTCPECAVSQEAARVAAIVVVAKGASK